VVSAATTSSRNAIDPRRHAERRLDPDDQADRVLEISVGENPRHRHQPRRLARVRRVRLARRQRARLTKSPGQRSRRCRPPTGARHVEALIHRPRALQQLDRRLRPASPDKPDHQRLSENGWGSCPPVTGGLSDNVAWIFPDGPRRAIPQPRRLRSERPVAPHATNPQLVGGGDGWRFGSAFARFGGDLIVLGDG
jgi:hypothetical protein